MEMTQPYDLGLNQIGWRIQDIKPRTQIDQTVLDNLKPSYPHTGGVEMDESKLQEIQRLLWEQIQLKQPNFNPYPLREDNLEGQAGKRLTADSTESQPIDDVEAAETRKIMRGVKGRYWAIQPSDYSK